jgi:hypothetical protein
MDLRRNRARAVAMGPRPETAVLARIQRGVVDGTLERVLLAFAYPSTPGQTQPAGSGMSTSALFEAAQAEGLQMLVLPQERRRLVGAVPDDALARLDAEIARGHVAVGPERAPLMKDVRRYAWWRIHPASGETTAVTDEGLHASSFEAVANHEKNTGDVKTIDLFYVGVYERTLLATLNQASFVRMGGIGAVIRILRTVGYDIIHRNLY